MLLNAPSSSPPEYEQESPPADYSFVPPTSQSPVSSGKQGFASPLAAGQSPVESPVSSPVSPMIQFLQNIGNILSAISLIRTEMGRKSPTTEPIQQQVEEVSSKLASFFTIKGGCTLTGAHLTLLGPEFTPFPQNYRQPSTELGFPESAAVRADAGSPSSVPEDIPYFAPEFQTRTHSPTWGTPPRQQDGSLFQNFFHNNFAPHQQVI